MNARSDTLLASGRRKITRADGEHVYLIVIDEYAYFSATVGTKTDREKFASLTRDLVARGRAAGVIIILATQRPSHQVIDPSMRDLFGYRWAFRCTTDSSSDTVLGQGWASEGYAAANMSPSPGASAGCCPSRHTPRIKATSSMTAPSSTWPPRGPVPPRDRRMSTAHALNGHNSTSPAARTTGPDAVKTT